MQSCFQIHCDIATKVSLNEFGPVNAHLISGPRISTKYAKPGKKGKEITLTVNTHLLSLAELVVCIYIFQATGCNSF